MVPSEDQPNSFIEKVFTATMSTDTEPPIAIKEQPRARPTGVSLYLRFPQKINVNRHIATKEVKKLNSKIINVRFPRQKSANFCLVDFQTPEDCAESRPLLKKVKIGNRHLIVKTPIVENEKALAEKIEEIAGKRNAKSVLGQLILNIKKSMKQNYKHSRTNALFIKDIPKSVKESEVRSLFPGAMEFRFVQPKQQNRTSVAFITLPTPKDAQRAAKQKYILGGKSLSLIFQKDPPEPKAEGKKYRDVGIQSDDDDSGNEIKTEIKEEEMSDAEINGGIENNIAGSSSGLQQQQQLNLSNRYYVSTLDAEIKSEDESDADMSMKIYN